MHSTLFTLLLFLVSLCFGIEICPTREITLSYARVTSTNYPNEYKENSNCTLTIKQPLDTKITFTFAAIDIEGDTDGCYDHLTVNGLLHKEFCGETLPVPYSSTLNIVKLKMFSDESVQKTGFDLTYTTVLTPNLPTPVSICPTKEANAAQIGRIMSPAFPENYHGNLDCKLTLKIPPNKKTEISYHIFSLEFSTSCANDKLKISSSGGQQQIACGTGSPTTKEFEGNEVYLHLTTNGNKDNIGFMLSYRLLDIPNTSGTITLPPTAPAIPTDDSCACPDGHQYIKRLLPQNNMVKRQNDDFSLDFKTTDPNALFLYGKGNVRDYILLKLENGNIVFEVDLGTGVAKVPVASGSLNDNLWHSVAVERRGKVVTVKVNGGSSQAVKFTPGSFTMLDIKGPNAALYVLGGPSGVPFEHNFKGCVRNLNVDGMKPIEAVQKGDLGYVLYGPSVLNKCS